MTCWWAEMWWKNIDKEFPTFKKELRYLRVGLATNGMNPYGNLSTNNSSRPLLLATIYVYGATKGESSCTKYSCIIEETWQWFVQTRESEKREVNIITYIYFIIFLLHTMLNTK